MIQTTKKGMAIVIYMPDSHYVLVSKGRKTETAILQYLRERIRDLPDEVRDLITRYQKIWSRQSLNERSKFFRSRRYYVALKDWILSEPEKHVDLNLEDIKIDKLELTGGKIESNEFRDYPEQYAAFAATREFSEEAGLLAQKTIEQDGKRIIVDLFELVCIVYTDDFDLPEYNYQYENWVFWVNEINAEQLKNKDRNGFPVLRETGVKDENFPPFYMPISRLTRYNFHLKHGDILCRVLQERVERGIKEYELAVEHLSKHFPKQSYIVSEKLEYTPPVQNKETEISDEEDFLRAMEGVTPLAR